MRLLGWSATCLLTVAGTGGWLYLRVPGGDLPPGLTGAVVYVSDRTGMDTLYLRPLPDGEEQQLTFQPEPVGEPAVSPDGKRVAFSMNGRIGIVDLATRAPHIVTNGVAFRDGAPAWRSDGKALVVAARRHAGENADVHLLALDAAGGDPVRTPLTETPGIDEATPIFGPADFFVVFVREEALVRLELKTGKTRRLTGGFKRARCPRFLPSGRLAFLWSEGKQYGIDVADFDGKNRHTLAEGPIYYRTLSPSRDGHFLAATFTFDLGFHPTTILRVRQTEEVRLLDVSGRPLGVLARSWRSANHSPDWIG